MSSSQGIHRKEINDFVVVCLGQFLSLGHVCCFGSYCFETSLRHFISFLSFVVIFVLSV